MKLLYIDTEKSYEKPVEIAYLLEKDGKKIANHFYVNTPEKLNPKLSSLLISREFLKENGFSPEKAREIVSKALKSADVIITWGAECSLSKNWSYHNVICLYEDFKKIGIKPIPPSQLEIEITEEGIFKKFPPRGGNLNFSALYRVLKIYKYFNMLKRTKEIKELLQHKKKQKKITSIEI